MLTIVVYGRPQQQGSFRAITSRSTGRPMLKKDNEGKQVDWRANIRGEAKMVMGGRDPLEGPVVLAVTFTRSKPASEPKRKPSWPWRKPDLDKYLRAVMDGLRDGGVYRDDAQVVEILRLAKHYPLVGDGGRSLWETDDAMYMLQLCGTFLDVMNTPGVVVRVAHLTEFEGVRKQLADVGFEPKDITGGR